MHEQVVIRTRDGDCPTHVFTPTGEGPWPAAIFYMDGFGIRPTLLAMAQRLADHGYVVLLPDLYYRMGGYEPLDPMDYVGKPGLRKALGPYFSSNNNALAAEDSEAFLGWLDARPDVLGKKIGVTGYCMGGSFALATGGSYPDRVAAVACFHSGYIIADTPHSAHRFIPAIEGRLLIAQADKDPGYPPEMASELDAILEAAGLDYESSIWPARHGWTMPDFPVYDEAQAERHWRELFALFDGALK